MTVLCENGQLRVLLSESEICRYNIDDVFFETGSKLADKALAALLKTASAEAGYKSGATRFIIEIYPVFDGGCEILFIPDEPRLRAVRRRKAPKQFVILGFDGSEEMLDAVERLYADISTRFLQSSLYEVGKGYRLIVYSLPGAALSLINGYADKSIDSELERAVTAEHGKELCGGTAIETVGSAFAGHRTLYITEP